MKICDISLDVGAVSGNEKMLMFCKKVDKGKAACKYTCIHILILQMNEFWFFFLLSDDIKVIFAEPNSSWRVTLSPEKVHYQFGIALQTPPYRDQNIDKDITVQVMLYRPSDGAINKPCHFTYRSIASILRDCDAFTSSKIIYYKVHF